MTRTSYLSDVLSHTGVQSKPSALCLEDICRTNLCLTNEMGSRHFVYDSFVDR